MFKNVFDEINKKASIDKNTIFDIADSIKNADLSDEKVLRKLIRDISKVANKNVTKDLEDKIVKKIKNDGVPSNINDLF
ncbi:stage VI sporulation protein F [Mycoplasmatota bacterium]|nr:stage VI sporulation protein F [Mycoplasmatota bacterium]